MSSIATIELSGHLTEEDLATALARVPRQAKAVLLDCRTMTTYDFAARKAFVDWNTHNRHHIRHVAVVTDNALWPVVISAMALASRQNMKAFKTPDDARRWVDEG